MTDVPPPPPPPPESFGTPPPASGPDVGAALSYGWAKFQANVGPLIIAVIIPGAVSALFNLFGQFVFKSVFGILLFSIVAMIANAVAGIAIYRVALQITAGQPADIGKAFEYDRWGEWIVFSIVFGLMIGIGLVLCIIPGLFLLAFFGMAPYYFLDGGMSLGESLTASREAATSKGLAFPVLLSIIVGALGIIVCFVGALVTAPIAYVAVAYLYRYAQGQQVAA